MPFRNDPGLGDGAAATVLAFLCSASWTLVTVAVHRQLFAESPGDIGSLVVSGAIGLGPVILILFTAMAVRESTRARVASERVAEIAEASLSAPSRDAIAETRDLAVSLHTELDTLDTIVHTTAKRLDAFETGLRADGGLLARALAEDIKTMGAVRAELSAESLAVGEAVRTHVAQLREASVLLREETRAAVGALDAHMNTFSDVSAKIGAHSAEFAAAADHAASSTATFDSAIDRALEALAHATSLNESARKSAEDAASAAQEVAGAVRGAVRGAIAEARDAAKRLRTEAGNMASPFIAAASALPRFFSGGHREENVEEFPAPIERPLEHAEELRQPPPRPAARGALALALAPAVANDALPLSLANIVEDSGLAITGILDADALDHIAQAAKRGPDARRSMVRAMAPHALRRVSAHLRRDAHARREAEALRRDPGRALGAADDPEDRRRDLAAAFLLIDTVLG